MIQRFTLPVLLLSLATSAFAADLPVATASASITGLSYQLVDLDPNDGITPWIQFNGSAYVGQAAMSTQTYPTGNIDTRFTSGDIFSTPAYAYTSPNGDISINTGPTGVLINTQVNTSALNQFGGVGVFPSESSQMLSVGGIAGTAYGSGPGDPALNAPGVVDGDRSFTLSPKTALVITGVAQIAGTLDSSRVTSGAFLQGIQSGEYTAQLQSNAVVAIQLADSLGSVSSDENAAFLSGSFYQTLDLNGVSQVQPSGDFLAGPMVESTFSVRYTNDDVASFDGRLLLGGAAVLSVGVQVAAIPEPGTWALMVLGLLGVTSVVRRQSTNRQAS